MLFRFFGTAESGGCGVVEERCTFLKLGQITVRCLCCVVSGVHTVCVSVLYVLVVCQCVVCLL